MSNLGNLVRMQSWYNLNHYSPICWAPLNDPLRCSSMWLIWQTLLTTHSLLYILPCTHKVEKYLSFLSRQGTELGGHKMIWTGAHICGWAETCCGAPKTRWVLTPALFLIGLQNTGKLRYKLEMDFILWKQKWLIAEESVKTQHLQKELPLPTSQRSPVQPAWQMHFAKCWSQTPWWQLQLCSQPSPYLPSAHSEKRGGRLTGGQVGEAPRRMHLCLWNMVSHLSSSPKPSVREILKPPLTKFSRNTLFSSWRISSGFVFSPQIEFISYLLSPQATENSLFLSSVQEVSSTTVHLSANTVFSPQSSHPLLNNPNFFNLFIPGALQTSAPPLSFFWAVSKQTSPRTEFPCRVTETRCWRGGGHVETHPAHMLSPSNLGDTGTRPSRGHTSPGRGRHSAVDSLPHTIQEDRLWRGGRTKAFHEEMQEKDAG